MKGKKMLSGKSGFSLGEGNLGMLYNLPENNMKFEAGRIGCLGDRYPNINVDTYRW